MKKHFDFKYDDIKKYKISKCNYCNLSDKYHDRTSGLWVHKKSKLKEMDYNEEDNKFNRFINFIIDCRISFNIVERNSFKKFCDSVDFKPPCRNTIKNHVNSLREEIEFRMIELFKKIDFISLTVDMWSSNSLEHYLGLIAHFINENWELESFVLDIVKTDSIITSTNNIIKFIPEIAINIISSKIVSITSDGGRDVISAINTLKNNVTEFNSMELIPCINHKLSLIVKKVLEKKPLFKKILWYSSIYFFNRIFLN